MADEASQFHFFPEDYLALVRAEVPDYDLLQDTVATVAAERQASSILDLGTGLGTTAERVLAGQPGARLVGIDESPPMLDHARAALPDADLRVSRIEDRLPEGPFDLVISALAVHHLEGPAKADLFERVAAVLAPGGRFVLADVVVPEDPADAVTPLDEGYDVPSRADEQLAWLADAGFDAAVRWSSRDLVVIAADRT
jgi:tRNA (cmo5U34)-methyltransferase